MEDSYGRTPLLIAQNNSYISSRTREFLQKNNILYLIEFDSVQRLEQLLDEGHYDFYGYGQNFNKLLHHAARKGNLEIFKYLFQKFNITDPMVYLPTAAQHGKLDTVKFLIDNADSEENPVDPHRHRQQFKALQLATSEGQLEVIEYLITILKEVQIENITVWNDGARRMMSPLHMAAATDNFEMTKLLVEEFKADLSSKDDSGLTPLHLAVLQYHNNIVKYLVDKDHTVVNTKNDYGITPLLLALLFHNEKLAEFLIDKASPTLSQLYEYVLLSLKTGQFSQDLGGFIADKIIIKENNNASTVRYITAGNFTYRSIEKLVENIGIRTLRDHVTRSIWNNQLYCQSSGYFNTANADGIHAAAPHFLSKDAPKVTFSPSSANSNSVLQAQTDVESFCQSRRLQSVSGETMPKN